MKNKKKLTDYEFFLRTLYWVIVLCTAIYLFWTAYNLENQSKDLYKIVCIDFCVSELGKAQNVNILDVQKSMDDEVKTMSYFLKCREKCSELQKIK